MKIFFFNNKGPRSFNYQPRYWDPQKEAKMEREARIKREVGIEDETTRTYSHRSHIKQTYGNISSRKDRQGQGGGISKTFGLLIVLALLLIGAYYFFYRI